MDNFIFFFQDCYTLSIHPPTNENDQWYSKIKWVSTNNTLSYARSMAAASTILNGKVIIIIKLSKYSFKIIVTD